MSSSEASGEDRGVAILLVEDEDTLRGLVAQYLRRHGIRVREAATAAGAMAALDESIPDVMILDINLPDLTGWDVLRELQATQREVRTVIVSAVRVAPQKLREFRRVECLPKPFPLEALLRIVNQSGLTPASLGTYTWNTSPGSGACKNRSAIG